MLTLKDPEILVEEGLVLKELVVTSHLSFRVIGSIDQVIQNILF